MSVTVRVSQVNKFKQFSSLGVGGTLRLSSLKTYLVLETNLVNCFKLKRSVHVELNIVYLHTEFVILIFI